MAAIVTAVGVYLIAFGFSGADFQPRAGAPLPLAAEPALVLTAVIAQAALLPFLVAVALSEIFRIRSMLVWILFGGALRLRAADARPA